MADDAVKTLSIEDDTKEDSAETLFARNLAAFKEHFSDLGNALERHRPVSKLVYLDNGEPTVRFQEFDLYPEGAGTYVQNQMGDLDRHGFRLTHAEISADGLDLHAQAAFRRLQDRMQGAGYAFSKEPARRQSYYTIVFGIGLAQHLDALVEHTNCRVLVLTESNLDFLYHSLSLYDWAGLIERMQERGGIRILVSNEPSVLSRGVHTVFRTFNPTGLDGSWMFRHYQSAIFQETERELRKKLRTSIMGLGFFQDEVNMVGQTYKNLEGGTARLLRKLDAHPGLPAFIIGTGPSLEKLIEFIRENQDKAVLFACGTSIDVLMKNGITPDFWVMMERSHRILRQAQETDELYDTSEVRFVGSTTIYPGVPECFKEAIFFFRPGLSSAPVFAQRQDQIALIPDPLAANAGMSFALHVGFREMYFLGVDVGSRFQTHGHAKGSWYERHDAENIKNLSIPLPGNFGGTVWTTPELQWSKESLEKLATMYRGRQYYNLGDGALIKNVTPKHPKAIKLTQPTAAKAELIARLVESCPVLSEAEFETAWEKAALIDRLDGFCESLKASVVEDDDLEDLRYVRDICQLLEPALARSALAMLVRGTLFGLVIAYEYHANRLAAPEERAATARMFKEEFCTLVDTMRERAIEVFTALEEGEPWEEFVS